MNGKLRNFESFHPRRVRSGLTIPAVTITRGGVCGLNKAAYEALGRPNYISYGFEHESGRAGIRAATEHDKTRYHVRANGASGNSWQVNARAFVANYDIAHGTSRVYSAEMDDGWLAFTPERVRN